MNFRILELFPEATNSVFDSAFLTQTNLLVLSKSFMSFSTQRIMGLPMIRPRTSSTPIGRTPGLSSRGIRRQVLYGISALLAISSVAIFTAKRATVRQSDVDDWLKLDIQRFSAAIRLHPHRRVCGSRAFSFRP